MHRSTFLAVVGTLGLVIGLAALCFPAVLLAGKGVPPEPAPCVWVREVGILILALSLILLLVRDQPDTPAMRAVLWGNAVVHGGLLPIEIVAWHAGVITRLDGIMPNSVLHVLLGTGFVFFARRVSSRTASHAPTR